MQPAGFHSTWMPVATPNFMEAEMRSVLSAAALSQAVLATCCMVACTSGSLPPECVPVRKISTGSVKGLPVLSRDDFNRLAVAANQPLYWLLDDNEPGRLNPCELVVTGVGGDRSKWLKDGQFTPDFDEVYRWLVEARRQEAVAQELAQGRPTLVSTDLSKLSADEKEMVRRVLKAAELVDALHRMQRGSSGMEDSLHYLRPDDQALFLRNNGPWCEAPATQSDPFCNASPDFVKQSYGAYPSGVEHELKLCETLAALPDGQILLDPYTVVRQDKGGKYYALPLHVAWNAEMKAVAEELRAASKAAEKVGEAAFAKYLDAAAVSFEPQDDDELPAPGVDGAAPDQKAIAAALKVARAARDAADEAWVAMNPMNSKYYLRIGADEVYWDLCQQKAGFHAGFALIDKSSLELQEKLNPLRTEMENSLAVIAPVYTARDVKFQMPDFIQIIQNSGDARKGLGATIGQSLPNWGAVVERGGSRTVVMTNLYQDPDSKALAKAKALELLAPETMAYSAEEQRIALIDIILHEATHNLGPYSDFRIDGKRPGQIFGGGLATVLEELKAQSGSWFYVPLLLKAGVISEDEAKQLYTHALVWSFGHLSQGLFAADGNPKPYSQLSAVIVGRLVDGGALEWVTVTAADGSQKGLFRLNYDLVPAAVEGLMRDVVAVKATGDVAAAKALVDPYVTGEKKSLVHLDDIKSRLAKFPRASMVYQVTM